MAFQKVNKPLFPARKWSLVGAADDGKSTFALQMRRPTLFIDSDQRISGRLRREDDDVYRLGDKPEDAIDPVAIQRLMKRDMPGSGVNTVVVDSVTSFIGPTVNLVLAENQSGNSKNKASGFAQKANHMRLLQDALVPYGTDILFIWHLEKNNYAGNAGIRETLSETERERLVRSLNAELQVIWKGSNRGILVKWSRDGLSGAEIWDESGYWKNMPERIDIAMHGFPGKEDALRWAVMNRRYAGVEEALVDYDAVKAERKPMSALEMWMAWGDHVLR